MVVFKNPLSVFGVYQISHDKLSCVRLAYISVTLKAQSALCLVYEDNWEHGVCAVWYYIA